MDDREPPSDDETALEQVVSGSVVTLTLLVGLGLLALGNSSFWIVFAVGFGGVLPLALGVTKLYERNRQPAGRQTRDRTTPDDALATLRQRYAQGELSEQEFERRVERLIETESVDDASTGRTVGTGGIGDREREPERE